jgi:tetratricopeptide (TPR) repeat protein/TolB-like protein
MGPAVPCYTATRYDAGSTPITAKGRSLAGLAALLAALPLVAAQTPAPRATSRASTSPPGADPRPRLAVIGFEPDPQGDPRDAWIAVAFQEFLARRLQNVSGLIVVPTLRLYQARRELTDPGVAPVPWPEVVRSLGAGQMLSGRCRGPDNATALELTLQNLRDPTRPVRNAPLPAARLFETLDQATRWTLEALAVPELSDELRARVFAPPSRTTTAVQYYALSLSAARAEKGDDALRAASQALEADQRFRPALAVLAQLEAQLGPAGRASAGRRLRALSDLARFAGDPFDRGRGELGQSLLALADEAFEAACTRAETALLIAFEHDDLYGQLAAITALCDSYLLRQPPESPALPADARTTFRRQCLKHAAEWQEVLVEMLDGLGDVVAGVPAANKLAMIYERLAQPEAALEMHQRTVALATEFGPPRLQATAWLYLGQWYRNQDRLSEALDAVTRCLALANEAAQPAVRLILADIYRAMTLPEESLAQLQLAYDQLRKSDDLAGQFKCLREMAVAQMQLGRRDKAITALQEAIDIAHVLELREERTLRTQLENLKTGETQSPRFP